MMHTILSLNQGLYSCLVLLIVGIALSVIGYKNLKQSKVHSEWFGEAAEMMLQHRWSLSLRERRTVQNMAGESEQFNRVVALYSILMYSGILVSIIAALLLILR